MSVTPTPTTPPQAFQAELRRLVADNRLRKASQRLDAATTAKAYGVYHRKVLQHAAQLAAYEGAIMMNTTDPAALVRNRNQLSQGLLLLIDELPDAAALAAGEQVPEGMAEDRLKKHLFWGLLVGKLSVILFAFVLWQEGSFYNAEFLSVVGIVVPVFASYLTLMVQDATNRRSILEPGDVRVSRGFARIAYVLMVAYPVALLFTLNLFGSNELKSFAALTASLALVETGLGAYLGKVVFGLFQKS